MNKIFLILVSYVTAFVSQAQAETVSTAAPSLTPNWQLTANTSQNVPLLRMRDPFSEPQVISNTADGQQNVWQNRGRSSFGIGFQRSRGDIQVPELIFKGFIDRGKDESPMALIQVGNKHVHMVREGDEINIDPRNPRQAIRITKISKLSLTVETGTMGLGSFKVSR